MKTTLLLTLFLAFSLSAFAQQEEKLFPQAVKENLRKYNSESEKAYRQGDLEKGQFLFDTLVNNQLVGTKFQDYSLKKISGGRLKLSSIKKPVMIRTYASWCVLNKGEIPALNKLAKKYSKDLKIVVVFWDKRQNAKNIASQFNGYIEVCYANENNTRDEEVVSTLKYSIGYLTSYFLDENLKVIDIKKDQPPAAPKKSPIKEAIKVNYDAYNQGLTELLLKSDIKKETLATQ
ncbi:TlpA family protein disulfide reductase [Flavobacterium sp. 3HN19-14]|uniref:TlpA family protein disulfide reductase n=1 Tax=Flavobacterium sp. 3HN19-14 TaxID=3448133 RepID=UPI003EE0E699